MNDNNQNHEKKITIADPRLTAYLLNELSADEKDNLEKQIAENSDLAKMVADLEITIGAIRQALQNEPLPETSSNESDLFPKAVESETDSLPVAEETLAKRRKGRWRFKMAISVAVLVFIAVTVAIFIDSGKRYSIDLARSVNNDVINEQNNEVSRRSFYNRQNSIDIDEKPLEPKSRLEVLKQKELIGSSRINASPTDQKSSKSNSANTRSEKMTSSAPQDSTNAQRLDLDLNTKPVASPPMPSSPESSIQAPIGENRTMSGSPLLSAVEPSMTNDGGNMLPSVLNEERAIFRKEKSVRESIMKPQKKNDSGVTAVAPQIIVENEGYAKIAEKSFVTPKEEPFSTFSIDVDTASWANIRRFLTAGNRPPEDAVKIEEIVNYFKYDYKAPDEKAKDPFAVHTETAPCPWCADHLLVKIGIKGKEIKLEKRPPLNLVFLVDTSGSMYSENKLPLVKKSLAELTEMLTVKDRIAIVTYGSDARVALDSVSGTETAHILDVVNGLSARGSTAGAAGIKTAYQIARKQFDKTAANRVILCTDGDFNVGMTNNQDLEKMIEKEAKSGVYLSILGFGMGNYKDDRLATLSNRGNGNYGYIDTLDEARRLLVQNLTGTLITIAKDVKIQVDFNPNRVAGYRLLGYEDRHLAAEDFNNDKKDAGEIGAGHTVTALYEIVPVGVDLPGTGRIDQSRYAETNNSDNGKPDAKKPEEKKDSAKPNSSVSSEKLNAELMFVKIRYKQPDATKSNLMTAPVFYKKDAKVGMSSDYKFACATALFGLILRDSAYIENAGLTDVLKLAEDSVGNDKDRKEFVELVKKAIINKDREQ